MTATSHNPDLRRIGESAFTEALSVLLSLPATLQNSSSHVPHSDCADRIASTVLLTGLRLSGSVQLQLPRAFVVHAVRLLTGLDGITADADSVLEDTAGELANTVAGRVAAHLAADGYPCTLGTPSVSRSAYPPLEIEPGVAYGRTDLVCLGHFLSLEVQCRYAVQ
jgi:CheY-specific phosphatase CheX